MNFRHVLVPHDFSVHADAALKTAIALTRRPGGRVTVLHVITPVTPVTDVPLAATGIYIDPKDLVSGARHELERRVARLVRRGGPKVDCKVEIGHPHQEIVDAAKNADAIVMSTAGRTGLSHLLIGSVAEKVVRHASVPVITLRPSAERRAVGRRTKK